MKRCVLLAALALLVVGCGNGLTIPKPGAAPARPVPPAPASTIRLPISIDLAPTLAGVETAVPRMLTQTGDWQVVSRNAVGDLGIRYTVHREPLKVSVAGKAAEATTRLFYSVEAAQKVPRPIVGGSFWQTLGTCGRDEPRREAIVGLRTSFELGADWRLVSRTTLLPATFVHQCRMTFLGINVTEHVAEAMRTALGRASATVDQRIASAVDVRAIAARAWSQMATPIALAPDVWLQLSPRSASLAELTGTGSTVTATLGITATPRVVVGPRPAPTSTELPSLTAGTLPEGFHATVDAEISFPELNRQLATKLVGMNQPVSGHDVRVTSAEAYGAGDQVVLALGLAGDLRGTVYLVGDPAFDPATGELSLSSLDFSVETSQALVKVADWLNHEGFRRSIAQQARASVGTLATQVRTQVQAALNRELAPGVRTTGRVTGVRPIGVYVTPTGLLARAAIDGTVSLAITR